MKAQSFTSAFMTQEMRYAEERLPMNDLTDRCVLLVYSLMSLLFVEMDSAFVIAFFTAVIFSGFSFAFSGNRLKKILPLLYGTGALFFPRFCIFLPLICYDLYENDRENVTEHFMESILRRAHLGIFSVAALWTIGLALFRIYPEPVFFYLLTGILIALPARRKTEALGHLHRRYQKTRDDDTELQMLLEEKNRSLLEQQDREIYTATLRERNRIAREIHDNVGHMLTRAILMVGMLKAVYASEAATQDLSENGQKTGPNSVLTTTLAQLDETLNQAMNSIRQSVHDLHDSTVNLQDALQSLIREFTFCPVSLQYDMSPEIPREVKYSFIAIAKEALVNISRHSDADAAAISAVEHPGFYQLVIEDNGTKRIHSDVVDTFFEKGGIGLANMENRVCSLNGNFRILTENGFRIYITVPKVS